MPYAATVLSMHKVAVSYDLYDSWSVLGDYLLVLCLVYRNGACFLSSVALLHWPTLFSSI